MRADRLGTHVTYACAVIVFVTGRLAAQTQDQARLVVGISAGVAGGVSLYRVAEQPIYSVTGYPSTFNLDRRFRQNVTASGHMTYFPGPRLGFSLEFTYLGLGTTDACTLAVDGGDIELRRACTALDGHERSPATSEIQAGLVLRPFPQSPLQPYLKVDGGMAFTPNSTMYTVSDFSGQDGRHFILTVYQDDSASSVRPSGTLAFGVSTAPRSGYQLRLELRESWMRIDAITAPTQSQGLSPQHRSVLKGFPSIVIGFDVVLAKRRGRRY